jgi:hypothetical protein
MSTILYTSVGTLKYSQDVYRLVMEVDQGINDMYRSLIPKWYPTNRPRWPAHVTVVRQEKEMPVNLEYWGRYQDEQVEFYYSPEIKQGKIYFWLNVFCVRLEEIRRELGLPVMSEYTLPPEGFAKCFHTTIANMKEI